jgi:hypothetical protein
VRLLLDLECGVTARNNDALRCAISYGHTEIVRMLFNLPLERGVTARGALRNAAGKQKLFVYFLICHWKEVWIQQQKTITRFD